MWLKILIIIAAIAALYLIIASKFRTKPTAHKSTPDDEIEVLSRCEECGTYCPKTIKKNGKKLCEECVK